MVISSTYAGLTAIKHHQIVSEMIKVLEHTEA